MIVIDNKISIAQTVLVGNPETFDNRPVPVWDAARVSFLSDLSKELIAQKDTKNLPDVMSFAYWIRKGNLTALEEQTTYQDCTRVGLGLVFHICPSNVPVNFAFSMAFGLLSGNSCVLRLPSAETPTTTLIVEAVKKLLQNSNHKAMNEALLLLRYDHNDEVNAFWLSQADGRIIWGGNQTVQHMRSFKVPPRSREIAFPDRYSLCALHSDAILNLDDKGLDAFCNQLHNDIYLMDQAACSSPQLLVWTGDSNRIKMAQDRLWPTFIECTKKRYDITPIQVMDKFVDACDAASTNKNITSIKTDDPILYRYELNSLDQHQDESRGYSGTIHEISLTSLNELAIIVNETFQTLTYFGYSKDELMSFINNNRLRGIDRIVPVGQALDMDITWDGYDMISSLSRIVDIR